MGIDPGLSVTGFGMLIQHKNEIRSICYGTIRPPAKESLAIRLKYLHDEILKIMNTYQPDELAIEDTFYQKNVKSAIALGQARGTLLVAGANFGIQCAEYAPRKVKKSVVGNGAATKEQVQYMVQRILNLTEVPKPLDASDALAVGICHLNQPGLIS
ncbi:MAG: crossover junction endodeoxyribonuclease RuvC [Candidatus Marinimicrobia bacterium]|nr:crossover junction endodeoxyribonuclease RuvC [Candidatus Neomarinimicrobiota bacterium]